LKAYWPFIVIGLTAGSVYALAAMGLVVTYTTSGVFNFAHGATGMFATFVFYEWRETLPTWLAFVLVVLVIAPLFGAFVDSVLFRRLAGAPTSVYVVASLGLLVALQATALTVFDVRLRQAEPILPGGSFSLGGVYVGVDQACIVAIAAVAAVGLGLFFRRTHLGLQTRAVIADSELTELVGADSRSITMFSWMLGCSFAAVSGILLAPSIGLDAVILTLLVVQAFGAASVGRFTSLPLTYAGALGIGVLAALSTKWVTQYRGLAGIPSSLPFLVLFGVLVLSPKGTFREIVDAGAARRNTRRIGGASRPVSLRTALGGLVVAVAVPWFLTGSQLVTATATVAYVLIFSSLGLLVGLSRQVSLCHATFVVIGTTTLAHLLDLGVPYPLALPLAGLIVAPIGALIAIPALRLSGLFLALATFGFGVAAQYLLFSTGLLFGQDQRAIIGRPDAFGLSLQGDVAFYFFALVVVVLGVAGVETVRRTRLGRLLRALADSPDAVRSLGVNPTASRVLVFAFSAFLAAMAGGLLGALYQRFNTFTLDFFQSLVWLTVLVTAGAASLTGSVLAALLFVAVPAFFVSVEWFGDYQPIFFGVAAIFLAQAPDGLTGLAGRLRRIDFAALAARSGERRSASWHRERREAQPEPEAAPC
jgi:branched-subunit amino acid ABC-type transport system permease component